MQSATISTLLSILKDFIYILLVLHIFVRGNVLLDMACLHKALNINDYDNIHVSINLFHLLTISRSLSVMLSLWYLFKEKGHKVLSFRG